MDSNLYLRKVEKGKLEWLVLPDVFEPSTSRLSVLRAHPGPG